MKIISVGKKHSSEVALGIETYSKRLQKPFDITWDVVAPSGLDEPKARDAESETILKRLKPDDYVILLDEKGRELTSPGLADHLSARLNHSKNIVFIIGGAYGVNSVLLARADFVWSLSPLVFPHQLVRLILVEQIYRAQEITSGGHYHHL